MFSCLISGHSTPPFSGSDPPVPAPSPRAHPPALRAGGPCKAGDQCSRLLQELENIDDDTDEHGIVFVTTEDTDFAKSSAGIKKFPALVLYKNGQPLAYPGK